jgi:hypothetical protein
MGRYRKKPVVIEAWRVRDLIHAAANDWQALPVPVVAGYDAGAFVFTYSEIHVTTLEGTMVGQLDDWIIWGVKGEFYPCKPDIFDATYEEVDA